MDARAKLDLFCIATFCGVEEVYLSSAVIEPIRKRRNENLSGSARRKARATIVAVSALENFVLLVALL